MNLLTKYGSSFYKIWKEKQGASQSKDMERFQHSNNLILLQRIKMVSYLLIFTYIFYFYIDFILLREVESEVYRYVLIAVHLIGVLISLLFLLIYKYIRKNETLLKTSWPTIIITAYLSIYLLMGAVASVNSHHLVGNIDAYVIIVIGVATVFPFRPFYMLAVLCSVQILFLIGLQYVAVDMYLITKQMNTSAAVGIAILISFAFYSYRKNEFLNKLKMTERETNFRKLFNINPLPLILTNLDGEIILMNQRALDFYKITWTDMSRIDTTSLIFGDEKNKKEIVDELAIRKSIKNYTMEIELSEGSHKWLIVNYELLEFDKEECILTSVTDITDIKKMEGELLKHATTDVLTGVPNRRNGFERMGKLLAEAERKHKPFILCFVDINNLKEVNDNYGHGEGDALINTVAQLLGQSINNKDFLFRYGGDEFILVFAEKSMPQVQTIWNSIEHQFLEMNQRAQKPYQYSISHGFYQYEEKLGFTIEEMIAAADKEMYKEKLHKKDASA